MTLNEYLNLIDIENINIDDYVFEDDDEMNEDDDETVEDSNE